MATLPSPHPAVLMDALVEQYLLLLPPEEPTHLAHAALVSKQWHSVVTSTVFRRRYRELHRSPPLLGCILNLRDSSRFISMPSSFRPSHAHRRDLEAVHSSHGRVLLRSTWDGDWESDHLHLFVWNPITNKEWELPVLLSTPGSCISNWDAAVVCAVGDGCSHLDCHFKVVVVGKSGGGRTFSCFYSSETDGWSDRIFVSGDGFCLSKMGSVLIGNTIYFRRGRSYAGVGEIIIKYDLLTHQMCNISLQCGFQLGMDSVLIATKDGRLGVAKTCNSTLCLWLMEQGRLAESRLIQLHGLLPYDALHAPLDRPQDKPRVAAFADTGAGGVIFLRTCVGYFTIDLSSGRSTKVGERLGSFLIVPYVSFCTPASRTVSTDEGQGASVVISTDHEPGAGIAVTRDEGPGDAAVSTYEEPGDVVASTDEGQGHSMSGA